MTKPLVMADVFDVAAFVVNRLRSVSPMKLQKLVYYGQAWSLVRDGAPLFNEGFEAWRYGPVCPPLYFKHQHQSEVNAPYAFGSSSGFGPEAEQSLGAVLEVYGDRSPAWLSSLTHREDPWRDARRGMHMDDRGNQPITLDAMKVYYSQTESVERMLVVRFGKKRNRIIDFLESMSDDDAALIDGLVEFDQSTEVVKLSS